MILRLSSLNSVPGVEVSFSRSCWNMRISYCIHASIVEFTMLGRRASALELRGLWDSGYGQLK